MTTQLPPDAIEQAIIDALVAHRIDREGPDFDVVDPSLLGYAKAVARVARTEADDSYGRGRTDAAAQLVALADRLDDDCAHWGVASAISPGLRNAADVLTGESWLLKRSEEVGRGPGRGHERRCPMTSLFERISDEVAHFDRPADRALRAVLAPHQPEQHYAIGQDNRDYPSYLYCRTCRKASPCPPLLLAAGELGLDVEEAP